MSVFSTIICCINLTENSDEIVRYTRELAESNNAKILLVHAMPSNAQLANYVAYHSSVEEIMKQAEQRAKEHVQEFAKKNFAGLDVEAMLLPGDPAQSILKLADKRCADLIIMGSMSTKHWFSFMLSRPSDIVSGETRVPVMIIPNELDLECTPPADF